MAFLLLASSARDDIAAVLAQQLFKKKQQEEDERRLEANEETGSNHSHQSLPKNFRSKNHHHRPQPGSWKFHFHLPSRHHNFSLNNSTWRQRRRVKQAAKEIQAEVEERLSQSPFLTSTSQNKENKNDDTPCQRDLPILTRGDINVRFWLGRGGFCDAWEVGPFGSHEKAVFKHLRSALLPHHPSLFTNSSKEASAFVLGAIDLRMEALYLSQLSHPNIIELLGIVQPENNIPYGDAHHDGYGLLLETLYVTLDQKLEDWEREASYDLDLSENKPFRSTDNQPELHNRKHLETVLQYASQLADALEYLHERRIVVCDVKPSNVGLTRDETIKLFDFGLCRELPVDLNNDPHRLYTLPTAGTPNYLPPEVLIQKRFNCLADVYSWSIMLHYMTSLKRPFEDLNRKEHFYRVTLGGERPSLERIPSELHSLLQHTWEGDAKQRWTMVEAKQELHRIRKNMGFSLVRSERGHHRRASSNMNSLVYGGTEAYPSDPLKSERWTGSSMTAVDFEKYFAARNHSQ